MLMETERIYTEARISKSMIGDQWETDDNGNPIVIIEASNENLDYQEEQVMKSALLDSEEYFLENGVISYDHKHIPTKESYELDPDYNPEKYILGKPIEVWEGISEFSGKSTVFVKAALAKSNTLAKELIGKLADKIGTIFASVGGRRVKKALKFDPKTYKEVPTIIGVDWDEVALTYKPVNQTLGNVVLSQKEFVKSLTAGNAVNPAEMGSGGNTLQMQGTEKDTVKDLMYKIRNKEIKKSTDAINHLVNSGVPEGRAGDILKMLKNKFLGDVVMEDEKTTKIVETATDELLIALDDLGDGADLSKAKSDGKLVRQDGHMYKMMPDGSYEKEDKDSPDYKEEEKKVEKSIETETEGEFYDASQDVMDLKKSVETLRVKNDELLILVKSLVDETGKQNVVLKSIGAVAAEDSKLIKSIADAPQGRQTKVTNLKTFDRFEKSQVDKLGLVDQPRLTKALIDNKVPGDKAGVINLTFRRQGIAGLNQQFPEIVDMLVKE